MSDFAWLIYFEQGPDDLNALASALGRHRLTVTPDGPKALTVSDGHGTVRVYYNDAAHVRDEAQEILTNVPHPDAREIANCSRRIELAWSLEDAPEVTNLLGFIEPAMRSMVPKCWVFDTWGKGEWLSADDR